MKKTILLISWRFSNAVSIYHPMSEEMHSYYHIMGITNTSSLTSAVVYSIFSLFVYTESGVSHTSVSTSNGNGFHQSVCAFTVCVLTTEL